jgi:hypothetical protein
MTASTTLLLANVAASTTNAMMRFMAGYVLRLLPSVWCDVISVMAEFMVRALCLLPL